MILNSLSTFYTKKTDRMDITIDVQKKIIFIQQKWRYNWVNSPNMQGWTYQQKYNFHKTADNLLWQQWSNHFKLKVKGASSFVKTHTAGFTVNFDVKWVLTNEHWLVNVKKIPVNTFSTSSVIWNSKIINLDTEDLKEKKRTKEGKVYGQYPLSHEFGHAVGNSIHINNMHGDEYKTTSAFKLDLLSRMNVGEELRNRHIDYVISQLNEMIPQTTFYVNSLR